MTTWVEPRGADAEGTSSVTFDDEWKGSGMDLQLAGKTALVTGGSRGIGRAIARSLAAEGVRVAICARTAEAVAATAERLTSETGSQGRHPRQQRRDGGRASGAADELGPLVAFLASPLAFVLNGSVIDAGAGQPGVIHY